MLLFQIFPRDAGIKGINGKSALPSILFYFLSHFVPPGSRFTLLYIEFGQTSRNNNKVQIPEPRILDVRAARHEECQSVDEGNGRGGHGAQHSSKDEADAS
jgi:hypothetical protein